MGTRDLEGVVLMSDYGLVNGGSAKVALMSARGIADAGVPVTLITGNGTPGDFLAGQSGLDHRSLSLPANHELPLRQRLGTAIWNHEVADHVRQILSPMDRSSTVVHIHSYRDVLSVAPVRVAKDLGFKVVFTVHDYRLGCPLGDFYDRQTKTICTLEGGSKACWKSQCSQTGWPEKLYQNYRFAKQRNLGQLESTFHSVVFVSRFSQQILNSYLAPSVQQEVIGNPIDFPKPDRRTLTADSPLVFLGRLQEVKDPVTAAKVAASVGKPILFLGDGELKGEVLAANPEAKFTGWVSPDQVREHLGTALGLVFPSRWYEGQPLAILEAIAHGVPVFCSDTCAGSESVEEYNAGVRFPVQNLEAIVEKVRPLVEAEANEQISQRAYERFWSDPPTLAAHTAKTLDLYRRVLAA